MPNDRCQKASKELSKVGRIPNFFSLEEFY